MSSSWADDKLYSSKKQDWGTPQALFDRLHEEFNFVLDAAASEGNHKCAIWIGEDDNALQIDWRDRSGQSPSLTSQAEAFWSQDPETAAAVWLNPPYGRGIGNWVRKAYQESLKGLTVVVLTFARTDTRWWHDWAMRAAEIRLIPGRVTFQGADNCAPAPSCLLVFDESLRVPRFTVQELPRK